MFGKVFASQSPTPPLGVAGSALISAWPFLLFQNPMPAVWPGQDRGGRRDRLADGRGAQADDLELRMALGVGRHDDGRGSGTRGPGEHVAVGVGRDVDVPQVALALAVAGPVAGRAGEEL